MPINRWRRFDKTTSDEDFASRLNAEFDAVYQTMRVINHKEEIIYNQRIMDTETEIPHNLGREPYMIIVNLKDDKTKYYLPAVRWWISKGSTEQAIYLRAEMEVTADIILKV